MIRADNRAQYTYIIMLTALSGKTELQRGDGRRRGRFCDQTVRHGGAEGAAARRGTRPQASVAVNQLEGFLPICSYCKKIRDGENVWHPLERFVEGRAERRSKTRSVRTARGSRDRNLRPNSRDCDMGTITIADFSPAWSWPPTSRTVRDTSSSTAGRRSPRKPCRSSRCGGSRMPTSRGSTRKRRCPGRRGSRPGALQAAEARCGGTVPSRRHRRPGLKELVPLLNARI